MQEKNDIDMMSEEQEKEKEREREEIRRIEEHETSEDGDDILDLLFQDGANQPSVMLASHRPSVDEVGFVTIEIYLKNGEHIHTMEKVVADASIGQLKNNLAKSATDYTSWHSIAVGEEWFDMTDDYCRFMNTKAVKDHLVQNKLCVTLVKQVIGAGPPCKKARSDRVDN